MAGILVVYHNITGVIADTPRYPRIPKYSRVLDQYPTLHTGMTMAGILVVYHNITGVIANTPRYPRVPKYSRVLDQYPTRQTGMTMADILDGIFLSEVEL